jgi:hypothetical protein
MLKFNVVIVVMLVLAACGKAPSDETATPDAGSTPVSATPAVGTTVAKEVEAQNGPYTLKVNPGQVFRCEGRNQTVAQISWNVDDASIGNWVEVKVVGPGLTEGKTFVKGGLKGTAETGNWVFEGTRFVVVNPTDGKELVSYQVTGLPCD